MSSTGTPRFGDIFLIRPKSLTGRLIAWFDSTRDREGRYAHVAICMMGGAISDISEHNVRRNYLPKAGEYTGDIVRVEADWDDAAILRALLWLYRRRDDKYGYAALFTMLFLKPWAMIFPSLKRRIRLKGFGRVCSSFVSDFIQHTLEVNLCPRTHNSVESPMDILNSKRTWIVAPNYTTPGAGR